MNCYSLPKTLVTLHIRAAYTVYYTVKVFKYNEKVKCFL